MPPRVIVVSSRSAVLLWNHSYEIIFEVINAFPPINAEDIRWVYNSFSNAETVILTNSTKNNLKLSSNKQSLSINPVQLTDSGRYTLEARNPGGASEDYVKIQVLGNRK